MDAIENAKILERILSGEKGPKADIVHLNAGAALMVGGLVNTLGDGVLMSREIIESGKALAQLRKVQL